MEHDMLSLWAINDSLEVDKCKADIDCMKETGISGMIFHPRFYPGSPDYLTTDYYEKLNEIILYSKEKNMSFWIYDENGWPSGTADGKVMEKNPSLKRMWIEECQNVEKDDKVIKSAVYYGEQKHYVLKEESMPSPIDKAATELFISITYDGYVNGISKEAFDYVTGFFSDETALPMDKKKISIPWSECIEREYANKCNRNLVEDLPALFRNGYFSESLTSKIRIDYWETATNMLSMNYYGLISEWCVKHGKHFTAHLRGEENLAMALPFCGSPFESLKSIDIPAVDSLGRDVSNQYFPRLASSISAIFQEGQAFCEALGGAGWGIEPEDILDYYRWLIGCGINISCLHINQYMLKAQALRDWPQSIPKHLSWKQAFPQIVNEIQDIQKDYNRTLYTIDTLVIAPVRNVMAGYEAWQTSAAYKDNLINMPPTKATKISLEFNELIEGLVENGRRFHIINEKLLEENCEFLDGYLKVGHCRYSKVIVHRECRFDHEDIRNALYLYEEDAVVSYEQTDWMVHPSKDNILPFGEAAFHEGKACKRVVLKERIHADMISSDKVDGISVNGKAVSLDYDRYGEHYSYSIPDVLWKLGENTIEIIASKQEPAPFGWIKGSFIVTLEHIIMRSEEEGYADIK